MTYAAIFIRNQGAENIPGLTFNTRDAQNLKGKLGTAISQGLQSVDNRTATLNNISRYVSAENLDELTYKFNGIGLAQLALNGRIEEVDILDYMFNGLAPQMDFTAAQLGYNSAVQMRTAIQNGNINVSQFYSGLSSALTTLRTIRDQDQSADNQNEIPIIIDMVVQDTTAYISETPDRKVQSGQTFNEYVHNLPLTYTLEARLQDGLNYNESEFESLLASIRESKIPFRLILGDRSLSNCIIQNFTPNRTTLTGISYSLELKQIQQGDVELVEIDIPTPRIENKNITRGQDTANDTSAKQTNQKKRGFVLSAAQDLLGTINNLRGDL